MRAGILVSDVWDKQEISQFLMNEYNALGSLVQIPLS